MTHKEVYDLNEQQYGCGYYTVCPEHSCPCHPTAKVSQGFSEELWERMNKHMQEAVDLLYGVPPEEDEDDYPEEMFDGPLDPDEEEPFNPSPRSRELVDTYLKSLGLRIVPIEKKED